MKRLVKRYRLPPMQFHAVILGYEVDFSVIDTPIVLEWDGWEFHDKRRIRYERDHERDVELTAAGYVTVRFTYSKPPVNRSRSPPSPVRGRSLDMPSQLIDLGGDRAVYGTDPALNRDWRKSRPDW